MLKITSLNNNTLPLLDTSQPERIRDLDGTDTLTLSIRKTDLNSLAFDMIENEAILTLYDDKYVIKDIKTNVVDDTAVYNIEAVHKFFNDTGTFWVYDVIQGRKVLTLDQALSHCLPDDYIFTIHDDFSNTSFENFGSDWSLSLFEKIRIAYNFEYVKDGTHLEIYKQIGNKTNKQMRYKHNIVTIEGGLNSTNLSTYIEGTGKPVEDDEGNPIEGEYVVKATYTSPLAGTYGIMHAEPVSDERFTDEIALLDYMKSKLNDTVEISYTITYDEFIKAIEDESDASLGDGIYLIHEILKANFDTRIVAVTDYPLSEELKPVYTISSKKESIIDRQVQANTDRKNLEGQVNRLDDEQSTLYKEIKVTDEALELIEHWQNEIDLKHQEIEEFRATMEERQEDILSELTDKVDIERYTNEYNTILDGLNDKVDQLNFDDLSGQFETIENEIIELEGEISSRITKTEFDDAVGVNKWISSIYIIENTDLSTIAPSFSMIKEMNADNTDEIDDSSLLSLQGTPHQITHLFTNVKVSTAKTLSLEVKFKNSISFYMNGAMIYQNKGSGETEATVSMSLRAGWNTIDILHGSASSSPKLQISPRISTQVDKMTTTIGVGDKNEARLKQTETQIRQTDEKIELKADSTVVESIGNEVTENKASIEVLSDQIEQKVEKNEFNAYSQRLTNAESSITQNAELIEGKVAKTDYDVLNGIVAEQTTLIRQNAESIKLKVEQNDLDELAGVVSSQGTQIGLNKTAISLKAEQADLNALSGEIGSVRSELNVQAGKIEQTVTKEEFGNLQIGGRNLFKGTDQPKPSNTSNASDVVIEENGEEFIRTTLNTASGYSYHRGKANFDLVDLSFPQSFTVSADIRVTKGSKYRFGGRSNSTGGNESFYPVYTGTGEWERISTTLTLTREYDNVLILWGGQSGAKAGDTIDIKRFQYERGNKATDWTPAPEDIEERFATAEATIKVHSDQILQTVTKTEFTTGVNNAISADKTLPDTRNDNRLPSWYFSNYPRQVISEFKSRSTLGVSGSASYGTLTTNVPWNGTSGGVVVQTFRSSDGTFERKGNSGATAWLAWREIEDVAGSQSKINSAISPITTRLTTAETSIKSNATAIGLRALKSDVYTKTEANNKISTEITSAEGRMKIEANTIALGVAETVVSDFGKTVGNLVRNPALTGSHTGWSGGSVTSVNETFQGVSTRVLRNTATTNAITYSEWFDVDPSKTYEVSMWVRKSAARGRFYVGLHQGTADSNALPFRRISNSTGGVSSSSTTNFYFQTSGRNTGYIKLVAYIMPSGTTPADMKGIGTNVVSNAIADPRAKRMRLRWLNYENGGTTTYMYVAQPKVVEVSESSVTRISKAEALIEVNKSDISSKVSTTDFTGNKITSLINQTATTISLNAGKINFNGAVFGQNATFAGDIIGGSIKSNTTINVTTNLTVGNNIYIGSQGSTTNKYVYFNNSNHIRSNNLMMYVWSPSYRIEAVRTVFISTIDKSDIFSITPSGIDVLNGEIAVSSGIIRGRGTLTLRGRDFDSDGHLKIGKDTTGGRVYSTTIYSRTYSGASNVYITSYGTLGRSTSARKYKQNIESLDEFRAEQFFEKANPVWYRPKGTSDNLSHSFYGYIADDIAEFEPRMVTYGQNDEVEGFNYDRVPALLHVVMKKDRRRIERLEESFIVYDKSIHEVRRLKSQIELLQERVFILEGLVDYKYKS